jgi:hypothetical protein
MRRRRQSSLSTASSSESNDTDLESCFNIGDELGSTNSDTNLIDYGFNVERENNIDGMIVDEDGDKDHPPEYYLN